MKKIIGIVIIFLSLSCDSDSGWDCIKTSGKIVQQEIPVASFEKITVWEKTKLFIEEGDRHQVIVETGKNMLNKVKVSVTDGRLEIHNNNNCNLVRDYGITKVYVTAPNITEIRSSTGMGIESIGILSYPSISLVSEDFKTDVVHHTSGDFKVQLDVEQLEIVANGRSKFYLSGRAKLASIGLWAGDCRVYAEDLFIQNLNLFHRSTGPMVVNPQESIRGEIVGWGDVIAKNKPPIVEVEELYKGRLIFE